VAKRFVSRGNRKPVRVGYVYNKKLKKKIKFIKLYKSIDDDIVINIKKNNKK
jgi:hypothetical protein